MSSKEDILTKEIDSWKGFEYALREENRLLFHKMLSECSKKEYADCMNSKAENFSAESLFLILILQKQKMINELVAKLRDIKKVVNVINHVSLKRFRLDKFYNPY